MNKARLEAFSDGVIAIIITIMVLELKVPSHADRFEDLMPLLPVFLSYALSFVYVGIYWNNHHHLLQAARQVTGRIMWANLHLLFWMSLIPFVTGWMGENHFAVAPTVLYGVVLFMSGIAFVLLQRAILACEANRTVLVAALGTDIKGKLSVLAYAAAIGLAFVNEWIADALYVIVAIAWFIPDRRIERALTGTGEKHA
jgi:uncharacterized membrane protein